MTSKSALCVTVASYISSEDASSDLQGLDGFYWKAAVGAYDAVLVVTDAFNQIRIEARAGRRLDDVSVGPLHHAFTGLFGGPFIAGKCLPLPADRRLSRSTLQSLGLALPAGSVLIVALGQTDEPERTDEAFRRAEWVQSRAVQQWNDGAPELTAVILDLLVKGAMNREVPT